jgi:hypothetical protein
MKRENGYYWVHHEGKWVIAEWDDESWWVAAGDTWGYSDDYFDEIDETKIVKK